MTESPLTQLVDALRKLAPTPAVTYRGLPRGAELPPALGALTLPTPTTGDHRLATEGDPTTTLLVLLTRSGRSLAALSGTPEEQETVLLPASVWRRTSLAEDVEGVVVLEELDIAGNGAAAPEVWPQTLDELTDLARARAATRGAAPATPVTGKFRGPWAAQPLAH